jgi:predicted anti-sigma-YlaC factor YlaD
MRCERAHELFSDRRDDVLSPILARELDAHLEGCGGCRELWDAFGESVEALRSFPVLEPPAGLAERAAAAAIAARRRLAAPIPWAARPLPRWVRAAAAVAMLATGATLLAAGPEAGQAAAAGPIAQRTAGTVSFLSERTERAIEDIRLMRIVVSAALGGRLDSLSDRLTEYRRNLERRRADRDAGKKSSGPAPHLSNPEGDRFVTQDGMAAASPQGPAAGATRSRTS